ncbi:MAG: hypothetical protein WKG52_10905 [Variovorax sp.]
MYLHDDERLVGDVPSVRVRPGGHEVEIENFRPVDTPLAQRERLGRLVLAEVLCFLFENFPSVQAVQITLSSSIDSFQGGGIMLAKIRADVLQSAGCTSVTTVARPHAAYPGHFAVSGVWTYSTASVAALQSMLLAERAAYSESKATHPTPRDDGWMSALVRLLKRLTGRR